MEIDMEMVKDVITQPECTRIDRVLHVVSYPDAVPVWLSRFIQDYPFFATYVTIPYFPARS